MKLRADVKLHILGILSELKQQSKKEGFDVEIRLTNFINYANTSDEVFLKKAYYVLDWMFEYIEHESYGMDFLGMEGEDFPQFKEITGFADFTVSHPFEDRGGLQSVDPMEYWKLDLPKILEKRYDDLSESKVDKCIEECRKLNIDELQFRTVCKLLEDDFDPKRILAMYKDKKIDICSFQMRKDEDESLNYQIGYYLIYGSTKFKSLEHSVKNYFDFEGFGKVQKKSFKYRGKAINLDIYYLINVIGEEE